MARATISKTLRFEVFKRDSFTCQYCGKMAPDVILEVDHIDPVKNKGSGNIINLITSCFDCNRGKGVKLLTDSHMLKKQQEQLKDLSEKRIQLQMMVKWKQELERYSDEQVDIINELLSGSGMSLSEYGRNGIKKLIKRFGFDEVYESTKLSYAQYHTDESSISKVIAYIPRICGFRQKSKDDVWFSKRRYICGIVKNRMGIYNPNRLNTMLSALVDGDESYECISQIAKDARNWTEFWIWINETYDTQY